MGKGGVAALTALLVSGAAAAPGASRADVAGWLRARAGEYEAHLLTAPAPESTGPRMWQEHPAPEALPDFVPPTSLAPLVRAVRLGVVNIRTVNGEQGHALEAAGRSLGSGFIISPDGYVVTNNHVVERARAIQVHLADGRGFPAEVVGRDPSTDVALLRLRGLGRETLPMTYLGDSDRLEVGDWVVAIGNPFGLDHSVAHGMISAKERIIGVGPFDDFIQTDALINPGNSGGPLFNMHGEVVGVTTAIASQAQGIGFAVPINMVKDLLPNLRENGRLERGWMGAEGAQHDGRGVLLRDVLPHSPAQQAGLKVGDRVVAVNGRPVEAYQQLFRRVAVLAPGTEVRLTVVRDGASQEVRVRLGRRPGTEDPQALLKKGRVAALGVVLQELSPELAAALGYPAGSGVLVADVAPGGPAARVGLRSRDLLVELNRRRVVDVAGTRRLLERVEEGAPLLLRVRRGDVLQYVVVETDAPGARGPDEDR